MSVRPDRRNVSSMTAVTPIGSALDELAARGPDCPAVSCGTSTRTRRELAERTNAIGRVLQAAGVVTGDLVTIALPTGVLFLEVLVATWKLGATPQPVSHRLPPAELESIIRLAAPRLVVGDIPVPTGTPSLPARDLARVAADSEPLPPVIAPSWKAPTSGGSTGTPKIIVSTRPGTAETVLGVAALVGIDAETVAFVPAPLYHNGPLQYAATTLLAGGHVLLAERFDAEHTLATIETERVTWLYAVPTMMHRILRLGEERLASADLSSLRTLFHLAAPCSPWLKRAWIDLLGPHRVLELYGATEGQGATLVTGREWLERPGTVGRAVVGEIAVFTDCGQPAPPGEVGEVHLRSATPTYRYIGASSRLTDEGWETLGDIGWLDDEGYLFLCDRATDMILVGGANVYPAEVEGALEQHRAVESACVVGLPDEEYGNVTCAVLHLTEPVSDEQLTAHLSGLLAPYKWPRRFERVDQPLRDDTGKVRRGAVRAAVIERLSEDGAAPQTG